MFPSPRPTAAPLPQAPGTARPPEHRRPTTRADPRQRRTDGPSAMDDERTDSPRAPVSATDGSATVGSDDSRDRAPAGPYRNPGTHRNSRPKDDGARPQGDGGQPVSCGAEVALSSRFPWLSSWSGRREHPGNGLPHTAPLRSRTHQSTARSARRAMTGGPARHGSRAASRCAREREARRQTRGMPANQPTERAKANGRRGRRRRTRTTHGATKVKRGKQCWDDRGHRHPHRGPEISGRPGPDGTASGWRRPAPWPSRCWPASAAPAPAKAGAGAAEAEAMTATTVRVRRSWRSSGACRRSSTVTPAPT